MDIHTLPTGVQVLFDTITEAGYDPYTILHTYNGPVINLNAPRVSYDYVIYKLSRTLGRFLNNTPKNRDLSKARFERFYWDLWHGVKKPVDLKNIKRNIIEFVYGEIANILADGKTLNVPVRTPADIIRNLADEGVLAYERTTEVRYYFFGTGNDSRTVYDYCALRNEIDYTTAEFLFRHRWYTIECSWLGYESAGWDAATNLGLSTDNIISLEDMVLRVDNYNWFTTRRAWATWLNDNQGWFGQG
jgi:hypothetical protein